MVGAITLVTGGYDLMPIEFGPGHQGLNLKGAGQAFNLVIIGTALALILLGSGRASVDYLLLRWFTRGGKAAAVAPPPPAALPEKVVAG
jgi:uncharacterized membrane protein YphA (DoxX/SURF4 family)